MCRRRVRWWESNCRRPPKPSSWKELANWSPSGGSGVGAIVVTAFALTSPDVVNWGSFDSFFNNCLLRRPPRFFSANQFGTVRTDWAGLFDHRQDPRYVTATRYFSRDVGLDTEASPVPPADRSPTDRSPADWHQDGCDGSKVGGMAAWNDNSGASMAAHDALREAAGISIPEARFVLMVLVIYLVILVPVNWGVCRMLGRVEWAWVAAPLIALIGAIAVIRLAQLDIGFVRSRTELAVLELQGGYPRAHLTRYLALYSSLSSAYELQFDDPLAIARPFPPTTYPDQPWPVTCRRDRDVRMSGFQVDSNTTGFVHAEQIYDLGGGIAVGGRRT